MSRIPRASVIVPVRNRPELLARALESLMAQDLPSPDWEIVVCDDGSSEDVAGVVARFSEGAMAVRLVRQPPMGPAAARNHGIRASAAPLVIFLDSDVLADRALVRCLAQALEAHPQWRGAEAALLPEGEGKGILWDAPASNGGGRYHTAAIAFRRDVLHAVGGFDETFPLPACEDVELAIRVLGHGPIGFVPEAIAWHPRREVTAMTHWRWRRHWRYEAILAVRYGILSFPGKPCGPFPRLRVALAAVVTLPAGRLLTAVKSLAANPRQGLLAALYALFDVLCGLWVLPSILFAPVPARRDSLGRSVRESK